MRRGVGTAGGTSAPAGSSLQLFSPAAPPARPQPPAAACDSPALGSWVVITPDSPSASAKRGPEMSGAVGRGAEGRRGTWRGLAWRSCRCCCCCITEEPWFLLSQHFTVYTAHLSILQGGRAGAGISTWPMGKQELPERGWVERKAGLQKAPGAFQLLCTHPGVVPSQHQASAPSPGTRVESPGPSSAVGGWGVVRTGWGGHSSCWSWGYS